MPQQKTICENERRNLQTKFTHTHGIIHWPVSSCSIIILTMYAIWSWCSPGTMLNFSAFCRIALVLTAKNVAKNNHKNVFLFFLSLLVTYRFCYWFMFLFIILHSWLTKHLSKHYFRFIKINNNKINRFTFGWLYHRSMHVLTHTHTQVEEGKTKKNVMRTDWELIQFA